MNRRIIYLAAIAVFIPVIVWFAGRFSGLPEVTFDGASQVADSVSKVLVPGRLAPDHQVRQGEGGLTFYLADGSGTVKRVVYDGTNEVSTDELNTALEKGDVVKVAGHICTDGEGERFHAKNVYISN